MYKIEKRFKKGLAYLATVALIAISVNLKPISVNAVTDIAGGTTIKGTSSNAVLNEDEGLPDGMVSGSTPSIATMPLLLAAAPKQASWSKDGLTYKNADDTGVFTATGYYDSSKILGIAGNFHIVAFDTATTATHTNGNILTNKLNYNSNFGTKGIDNELSYIASSSNAQGSFESQPNANGILGLGKNFIVAQNGSEEAFSVNGVKLNNPKNIIQSTNTTEFISLDEVKRQMIAQCAEYADLAASGNRNLNVSFSDFNSLSVSFIDPSKQAVLNLTANQLKKWKSDPLTVKSVSSNGGVLIINSQVQICV
jgi:hypothetical protein